MFILLTGHVGISFMSLFAAYFFFRARDGRTRILLIRFFLGLAISTGIRVLGSVLFPEHSLAVGGVAIIPLFLPLLQLVLFLYFNK